MDCVIISIITSHIRKHDTKTRFSHILHKNWTHEKLLKVKNNNAVSYLYYSNVFTRDFAIKRVVWWLILNYMKKILIVLYVICSIFLVESEKSTTSMDKAISPWHVRNFYVWISGVCVCSSLGELILYILQPLFEDIPCILLCVTHSGRPPWPESYFWIAFHLRICH